MTPRKHVMTLQEVTRRKLAVRAQITRQGKVVKRMATDMVSPFNPMAIRSKTAIGLIGRGVALMDGALVGYRLFKKIRRIFF